MKTRFKDVPEDLPEAKTLVDLTHIDISDRPLVLQDGEARKNGQLRNRRRSWIWTAEGYGERFPDKRQTSGEIPNQGHPISIGVLAKM